MKQGYAIRQVKDICAKGSSQVAQKDLEGITGDYPIFGASGLIKNVDFYHQEKEYIGLVKDGSGIGRAMFLPPKSSVIGTLQYILPKDGYNIRYIGYCLQSLRLDKYKQGAAIPHIYFKDYGEAQILVAENPDEQQRIVSLLDAEFAKIDTLKANAERNLQNAKDLFQAALKKEFSGNTTTLGSVLNLRRGHDLTHEEMREGGIPVAGSGGVIGYHNEATPIQPCITVGRSGSVGKVRMYDKCWAHNTVLYVDDFKGNDPSYLSYLLLSLDLQKQGGGCGVPTLNRNNLHPITIGYNDDIAEQQRIVIRLDNLNEKCKTLQANYEKTIALSDDLKQALLRKAFNGEI